MKACIKTAIKKVCSKEKVEIAGYICWVIGIFSMILSTRCPGLTILGVPLFSFGIAAFGVGTGFVGLGIARRSDKRMTAMANLEFCEKMAMVQSYIMGLSQADLDQHNKAYANKIFYDLKGAKQLKGWIKDPEITKMLDSEIQHLIDKALAGKEHEHLIKRLYEVKEGDC